MNIFPPSSELRSLRDHRDAPRDQQSALVTPDVYAHPHLLHSDDRESLYVFARHDESDLFGGLAPKRRRLMADDCPVQSVSCALRALRKPSRQRITSSLSRNGNGSLATPISAGIWPQQTDVCRSTAQSVPTLPASPYSKFRFYQSRGPVERENEGVKDIKVDITYRESGRPKSVPRLSRDARIADFCPWTGSQSEDILSNETITNGFQEKAEANCNECVSSHSSVCKQLNQPTNLHLLSTFLSSAIQDRQRTRKKSYPVHKHPRRLVFSEPRCEAWLRELADLNVPMQRLRRTIPLEIEPRTLLERCLAHLVPLERAIWLARCVNSNEFQKSRKAAYTPQHAHEAEIKIMGDWTRSAHQLLEGALTPPVNAYSRRRMAYVVQLCARLVYENLIDRDLAADMYLQLLEQSPIETLPLHSLFLAVSLPYLICCRDKAKRLANCFISKYEGICHQPDIYRHLIDRMHHFVQRWTYHGSSEPSMPYDWLVKNSFFRLCPGTGCSLTCIIPNFLSRKASGTLSRSPLQQLQVLTKRVMQILDASPFDISALLSICQQYSEDLITLATLLLAWASSTVRSGDYRTHAVASVFRNWTDANVDLDDLIITILPTISNRSCLARSGICHVISELVRSHSISMSTYLDWIVSQKLESDNFCGQVPLEIEVLVNIPSSALSRHVWNLRNEFLVKFGFNVSEERQNIERVRNYIRRRVLPCFKTIYDDEREEDHPFVDLDLKSLPRTVKTNVAVWLRDTFCSIRFDVAKQSSTLTAFDFLEIHNIFEQLEDIPMLADVLEHISLSQDSTLLTAGLQTLAFHLKSFIAMGVAGEIFRTLSSGIADFLESRPPSCDFLGPYISIAAELSIDYSTLPFFREISSGVRSSLEDTYFKESMISFDTADSPYWHDMRDTCRAQVDSSKLHSLLDQLFLRPTDKNCAINCKEDHTGTTLYSLRLLDPKAFDKSIVEWILKCLSSPVGSCLIDHLPTFVGLGIITLPSFYDLITNIIVTEGELWTDYAVPSLLQRCLLILVPKSTMPTLSIDSSACSFEKSRQEFLERNADCVLNLLQWVYSKTAGLSAHDIGFTHNDTVALVYELLLRSSKDVSTILELFPSGEAAVSIAIGQLLECEHLDGVGAINEMIEKLETFSADLCSNRAKLLIRQEKDDDARFLMEEALLRASLRQEYRCTVPKIDFLDHIPEDDLESISCRIIQHVLFLIINSNMTTSRVFRPYAIDAFNRGNANDLIDFYLEIGTKGPNYTSTQSTWARNNHEDQAVASNALTPNSVFEDFDVLDTWSKFSATIEGRAVQLFCLQTLLRTACQCFALKPVNATYSKQTILLHTRFLYIAVATSLPSFLSDEFKDSLNEIYKTIYCGHTTRGTSPISLQTSTSFAISSVIDILPGEALYQCARLLRDRGVLRLWDPSIVYLLLPLLRTAETLSMAINPPDKTMSAGMGPFRCQYPVTSLGYLVGRCFSSETRVLVDRHAQLYLSAEPNQSPLRLPWSMFNEANFTMAAFDAQMLQS